MKTLRNRLKSKESEDKKKKKTVKTKGKTKSDESLLKPTSGIKPKLKQKQKSLKIQTMRNLQFRASVSV